MPLVGLERVLSGGLRWVFGKSGPKEDVLELTHPITKKPVTRPKAVAISPGNQKTPQEDVLELTHPIAKKPVTRPQAVVISPEDQKKLQEKFAPLLKNNASTPAGSLHMLGLKELRSKIGDKWPRLCDAVYQTTENVLKRELNPTDGFLRIGEDVFLVGFDSTDPRPAAQRIADIAQIVREKILGETGDDLISVESLSGQLETFNAGDIEFRLPEPKPILKKTALKKVAVAEKKIPVEPVRLKPDQSSRDSPEDSMAKNVAEMFSKVTKRSSLHSTAINIMYVPVWDAYHGILTTFGVVPARQNRAGTWIYEHDVLGPAPDDSSLLELDLKSLVTALEMMVELYQNEFAIFLDTQIHYRSLASASGREQILDICRQIPEFLRKYLLVQIVNIPLDAPSSTIAMRLAQLRPFFRTVVVRAPSLKTDISVYFPLGVKSVSYPAGAGEDPDEVVKYLSDYVKKGIAAQVHITAEYVSDIEVARRLKEAGITHIGGGIVGAPISTPDNMRRCDLKDFPLY